MAQLPENIKQAFRVVKVLTPKLYMRSYIQFGQIEYLDKETRLRLYGYSSWISSYEVRILFLHRLLHIHGTDTERQFNGALFVICLFDILTQYVEENQHYEIICFIH